MKTKPEVIRPLPLSPEITEQSTRVLDAHDSLDVEQSILFGMYKGKKYAPSQLKGINSAGGMALVLKVLLPRFREESGKELVKEVMSPKYKQTHEVTRAERTIEIDGFDIRVIPKMTKSIKQWRNTAIVKPLGRLVDGYIGYLGDLKQPLHESGAGNLVQIPTGTNRTTTGARNTPHDITQPNVRLSVNFCTERVRIIKPVIEANKHDTADAMVLKWCEEGLHLFRGFIPKPKSKQASKKSKTDK